MEEKSMLVSKIENQCDVIKKVRTSQIRLATNTKGSARGTSTQIQHKRLLPYPWWSHPTQKITPVGIKIRRVKEKVARLTR